MAESLKAARERFLAQIYGLPPSLQEDLNAQLRELQRQAMEAILRAEGYDVAGMDRAIDALLDGPEPESQP